MLVVLYTTNNTCCVVAQVVRVRIRVRLELSRVSLHNYTTNYVLNRGGH